MSKLSVDVVVSFDTTGSMYPCLTQVRKHMEDMITQLFKEIPDLRMGIIAHGDYCDGGRAITILPLTSEIQKLCKFTREVPATNGGDSPECYELVLHKARSLAWRAGKKVLIVIGDAEPHGPDYPDNKLKLDWRNELGLLLKMGVHAYAIQCLGYSGANHFYSQIAKQTQGCHLTLDQFSSAVDLVMAICYQQAGAEHLSQWEAQVEKAGRMNRELDLAFAVLAGRKGASKRFRSDRDLQAVAPGRFQVMEVESDCSIRAFVEGNGIPFQKGRGFYKLTKTETIQDYKEIILRHDGSGDLYTGKKARQLLGLPEIGSARNKPVIPTGYTAFVQSTSVNRRLIGGTEFLYEVDRSR